MWWHVPILPAIVEADVERSRFDVSLDYVPSLKLAWA